MDILFQTIGWIATVLGLFMFMPQTIKTIKNKSVKGLSKATYTIYIVGASLWVLYTSIVGSGGSGNFIKDSFPAWAVNLIISLLLIPVVWLMFEKKIIPMILGAFAISMAAIGLGIYLGDLVVPDVLKLLVVIVAGSFTGLGFTPQLISTFKNRGAEGFSLIAGWMSAVSNILWTAFWIHNTWVKADSSSVLFASYCIATIFTATLLISSLLLVLIIPYFNKQKHAQKSI